MHPGEPQVVAQRSEVRDAALCFREVAHGDGQVDRRGAAPDQLDRDLDVELHPCPERLAAVGDLDGDLMVYEMALDQPTEDFTQRPAMSEQECAQAMSYGMMAVEPGIDLLMLGEMGIANTTSAAAIYHALYGGKAEDWTGPGTGVEGDALTNKINVVRKGVELHRDAAQDGLEILMRLGGKEIAAIAGAILAARMGRVPVILDGYICCAAAACLHAWAPESIDHCLAGHLSVEGAHREVLTRLGKKPILQLGMRLGEGSGATLAAQVVRSACNLHRGMSTFEDAGVSESVH